MVYVTLFVVLYYGSPSKLTHAVKHFCLLKYFLRYYELVNQVTKLDTRNIK